MKWLVAAPLETNEKRYPPELCAVPGCRCIRMHKTGKGSKNGGHGFCARHARNFYRHGSPIPRRELWLDRLFEAAHALGDELTDKNVRLLVEAACQWSHVQMSRPFDGSLPEKDDPRVLILQTRALTFTNTPTGREWDGRAKKAKEDLLEAAKLFCKNVFVRSRPTFEEWLVQHDKALTQAAGRAYKRSPEAGRLGLGVEDFKQEGLLAVWKVWKEPWECAPLQTAIRGMNAMRQRLYRKYRGVYTQELEERDGSDQE